MALIRKSHVLCLAWIGHLLMVPFPCGFCCFFNNVRLVWCHRQALGKKLGALAVVAVSAALLQPRTIGYPYFTLS